MKRFALLLMLLIPLVGCNKPQKSALQVDGSKYKVQCLVDAGITADLNEVQVRAQRQMATWMENDLLRLLTNAGYQSAPVSSSNQFKGGAGTYLLQAKIVNYNPGSKAARMFVGMGAGSTSIDIQYQIINGNKKQIVDQADGVGSSRDWNYCCRTLNQRMIATLGMNVGR